MLAAHPHSLLEVFIQIVLWYFAPKIIEANVMVILLPTLVADAVASEVVLGGALQSVHVRCATIWASTTTEESTALQLDKLELRIVARIVEAIVPLMNDVHYSSTTTTSTSEKPNGFWSTDRA